MLDAELIKSSHIGNARNTNLVIFIIPSSVMGNEKVSELPGLLNAKLR